MKHYTTNVLVLGAALLWGSAAAHPDKKEFESGVSVALKDIRSELLATDGMVVKSFIDYITTINELGNQTNLNDEERTRLVHATEIGTDALDTVLAKLKDKLIVASEKTRATYEQSLLTKQQGLVGDIATSYAALRKEGVSEKIIAEHTNNLISAVIFASDGSISKGKKLGAIAELAGANMALAWHARHPRVALYAVISASALAVGGMTYTVAQHRQPIAETLGQWFAVLTFGQGAKSFSLYDNPVIDALFTPLQLLAHPMATAKTKPVLSGLAIGGVGLVGIATASRLRKKHAEPYRAVTTQTRWSRLAGALNPFETQATMQPSLSSSSMDSAPNGSDGDA